MVQLKTQGTALLLYALLLVLPTAALGALHYAQIVQDHEDRLDAVPDELENAAQRLHDSIEERFQALIYSQDHHSYYVYRDPHYTRDAAGIEDPLNRSVLHTDPPREIRMWFTYEFDEGPEAQPTLLPGRGLDPDSEEYAELEESLRKVISLDHDDPRRPARKNAVAPFLTKHLLGTAYFAARSQQEIDEVLEFFEREPRVNDDGIVVLVYAFHMRFFRTKSGDPRVMATRSVNVEPCKSLAERGDLPAALARLRDGFEEVQGFFVDPAWFFETLPRQQAEAVLSPAVTMETVEVETATQVEEPPPPGVYREEVRLAQMKGMELFHRGTKDYGKLRLSVSTHAMEAAFERQLWRFFGVATMLIISLFLGVLLLLRSVRQDLKQAQRTENFVASVTHELRTPLTAIRLYGEMLNDGWVPQSEKRSEYYKRILNETDRLETMVERVLMKARLSSQGNTVFAGSLNELVGALAPNLRKGDGSGESDLAFDLAPDLPDVMLNTEGVTSIVTNLVENARKYAPVRPRVNGHPPGEPILVRTGLHSGRVVLEVSDRGPGIPEDERAHVFDAFYRIGTESKRTTKGTGLGLHLVLLQSRAMGGEVCVLDREGGGTVFRVSFRAATSA